jgi:hypothetical protein
MKLDTIEKHAGKVYDKKIVNGRRNLLSDGNLLRNVDMSNMKMNIRNI